ncbi:anthranilate synthase component i signature [Trichococcus palustris]|jgi:para-aminobenzoate synthetase component I|uniref:aminodeoxychorismate synthase n=1 Tax=Trichococcus palustris TaxID=140314 RepID=A0A143YDK1_9LACT|nr:aminodeoxychorismate synthase component I [Trichococcus palustris]CZQ86289.1 anthranilate synthase component i signature [Trichococcus palustris]SFK58328.1 aminodeoxychorismate synthase, subunit I [Trichococcus palustris]
MGKTATDVVVKEIDTTLSSAELFSLFKDREHCFFLDSGMDPEKLGRYSFIGFDPETKLTVEVGGNPFDKLKALLADYHLDYEVELPFIGGAVGYLGYDLCHHVERLPRTAVADVQIPDCFFGIYDGVIAVDHLLDKVYVASPGLFGDPAEWVAKVEREILTGAGDVMTSVGFPAVEARPRKQLTGNMPKEQYLRAIDTIKDYIRSGDIYQANMTQRFQCKTNESPYALYNKLRTINPAPFAAYLDFGSGHLLSSSPERFLQIRQGKVQTRPIKGTLPRGATEQEDRANSQQLFESEKDRSELLMIVDLMRNDLGRVCKTGSVQVTELFHIEPYSTVFQLVSTVEGELEEGVHAVDCIKLAFPGGSITGAPKIRAMEVIDEIEPTQRNAYTGSIGYIGFNGDADLNIVIRTILQKDDDAYFQVGGGIVWDSDPESEYQETIVKAKALMEALHAELPVGDGK